MGRSTDFRLVGAAIQGGNTEEAQAARLASALLLDATMAHYEKRSRQLRCNVWEAAVHCGMRP